jgi:FtsZ-binding cell division protein ZapB
MNFEFLDVLEQRVNEAGDRLAELREQNAALAARVAELERAAAQSAGEASWPKEREQLRKRVEKLAARLESLLSA